MLSKNAIGNLVNRYRAVLKKCNLMNTFGTIAIGGMFIVGNGAFSSANAYTPTLDDANVKAYLKTLMYDADNDLNTPDEHVFTDAQINSLSSVNVVEEENIYIQYYNTFTVQQADAQGNITSKNYGILLRSPSGTVVNSISEYITMQKSNNWDIIAGTTGGADFTVKINGVDTTFSVAGLPTTPTYNRQTVASGAALGQIKENFVGNSVNAGFGGAIYNNGTIIGVYGDFIQNSASGGGGAVYNGGTITTLTSDFIGNSADVGGGGNF